MYAGNDETLVLDAKYNTMGAGLHLSVKPNKSLMYD